MKYLTVLYLAISIIGCSAAGVPYTSDPDEKLQYGYQLLNMGRPLPAEKLGHEALDSYQLEGDKYGIAETYVFLSQLYKHPAYRQFSKHFEDYDPTNEKSIEYGVKAVEMFQELENYTQKAKAQFGLANSYLQSNNSMACKLYSESIDSYAIGKIENPGEGFSFNPNFQSFEDMVDAFKLKYCEESSIEVEGSAI